MDKTITIKLGRPPMADPKYVLERVTQAAKNLGVRRLDPEDLTPAALSEDLKDIAWCIEKLAELIGETKL